MGDEKGAPGAGGVGGDVGADARMGMIQINDLVYKLETDLSVAINRTHKNQFFQNQTYTNNQTAIAIVNSGADYIDPRRSFFTFDLVIPGTDLGANRANLDYQSAFVSAYFGKNGSVLNIIDSIVVSSRSGDELSRVNDYAQLMNILVPEMFGTEWRESIGQEIGLGSFMGGYNNSTVVGGQNVPGNPGLNLERPNNISEQRSQRFAIPLYLLSPIFNYGRLLPSMLMSGLRIEIKWKQPDVAFQQFWEGFYQEWPADGNSSVHYALEDNTETEFKTFLGPSNLSGFAAGAAIHPTWFPPATMAWEYTDGGLTAGEPGVLTNTGYGAGATFLGLEADGNPMFQPGDMIAFSIDNVTPNNSRQELRFIIEEVLAAHVFAVTPITNGNEITPALVPPGQVSPTDISLIGAWRLSQRRPLGYQRAFGGGVLHNKFTTPLTPITSYTINNPVIAMCSIQLTDAIQRTLNEFSSINGLEIVYADYDRTSTPLLGNVVSVYTEVRKSASRALAAFARVVDNSALPYTYDSFASAPRTFWDNYQWQLGSLYFPQQRVEDGNSNRDLRHDNVLALMYSYTQDAFDRYHPKAAPTMVSLRGAILESNKLYLHPTEVHAEHNPSTYLAPRSTTSFGKWGSFVNGSTTVATTLERSTLFDLSGIPINNSRVLALRGTVDLTDRTSADPNFQALLYVFLKYVRLARVFLVNCEVEQ